MFRCFLILATTAALAGPDEDDEPMAAPRYSFEAFDVTGEFASPSMGATPGGAQDIGHFRDRVEAGEVPLPETFTPEGLFSDHDLPLAELQRCDRLLCTNAKAVEASLLVQEDVRWMAQIGFTSGLDADFRRPPLNLVAVIDKSCSMSGQPIEMVRSSLRQITEGLRPDDQLSIVLYGSSVHTHLGPTSAARKEALLEAIEAVEIDGSTNLEAGLVHGFALARQTRRTFDGASRVMLFTDERPNTGRTDAEGFMGLAEAGSKDGIGMTTIGVGVQFGAELAQRVSSVRGGNLFFFSDVDAMQAKLKSDFDLMVTELAYDLDVTVRPAPGTRIAGIHGVPGDLVEWGDDGALSLRVATLFPSRERGGIFVSLAPDAARPARLRTGDDVASITLAYTPRDGTRTPVSGTIPLVVPTAGDDGLGRGIALVDEATALRQATMLHHQQNDQDGAWQIVHALAGRLRSNPDGALEPERVLVARLEETLAKLAGRAGEVPELTTKRRHPITGLPTR